MASEVNPLLEVMIEIRQLLRIIAEDDLARLDKEPRLKVRGLVGKSAGKSRAVMLMDGSRSQAEIVQDARIDQSDLSKLVRSLKAEGLLNGNENPKLAIYLPSNFFISQEGK